MHLRVFDEIQAPFAYLETSKGLSLQQILFVSELLSVERGF
jgi:hypothetical protein